MNVLIPRYAPNALTENNIIGTGLGQTLPDYVLLSHILNLPMQIPIRPDGLLKWLWNVPQR